jgi:hypothetical protein
MPMLETKSLSSSLSKIHSASSLSQTQYSPASAAGNLSSRGAAGLQWAVLHGRPVIGKDCTAKVGQRVVAAACSPLTSVGIGTIVDVDGCHAGFAAVLWDRERGSARPPAEFCVGHNGVYQLELAQVEDIICGKRYESIYSRQGAHQACSIEDLLNEPFGGPNRLRRFQIKSRPLPSGGVWQDPLHSTTSGQKVLNRTQGKASIASFQRNKLQKTLLDLFIRFARGSKRKRFFGYDLSKKADHEAACFKRQAMKSMNMHELTYCLQYLDVRQEKAFLRPTDRDSIPVLDAKGIRAQYEQFAPWSHPDAFGELDFDRFALCLESVSTLVGVPFPRFICGKIEWKAWIWIPLFPFFSSEYSLSRRCASFCVSLS